MHTDAPTPRRNKLCCTHVQLTEAVRLPSVPQSYLICLRGPDASLVLKGRAFLLPTLEAVTVGRKENGSAWGRGVWSRCSRSEVCLVGPELYWLKRLPAVGRRLENEDERKLLKLCTPTLERWAAIHGSLLASTNTSTQAHFKHACISNTQTPVTNTLFPPFYLLVCETKLDSNWSWGKLAGRGAQQWGQILWRQTPGGGVSGRKEPPLHKREWGGHNRREKWRKEVKKQGGGVVHIYELFNVS